MSLKQTPKLLPDLVWHHLAPHNDVTRSTVLLSPAHFSFSDQPQPISKPPSKPSQLQWPKLNLEDTQRGLVRKELVRPAPLPCPCAPHRSPPPPQSPSAPRGVQSLLENGRSLPILLPKSITKTSLYKPPAPNRRRSLHQSPRPPPEPPASLSLLAGFLAHLGARVVLVPKPSVRKH